MGVKLPTIIVVDPERMLQDKWWSLPDLQVAVTLFTATGRTAIARAREFSIDVLVVRAPVADVALDELLRVVRETNPGVRTAIFHGTHAPLEPHEIKRAAPDFVSSDAINPVLMSAVLSKMLDGALNARTLTPRASGTSSSTDVTTRHARQSS